MPDQTPTTPSESGEYDGLRAALRRAIDRLVAGEKFAPGDRSGLADLLHQADGALATEREKRQRLGALLAEAWDFPAPPPTGRLDSDNGGRLKRWQDEWNAMDDRVKAALASLDAGESGTAREAVARASWKQLQEFDAWLSFAPDPAEILPAFRKAFGTDTSAGESGGDTDNPRDRVDHQGDDDRPEPLSRAYSGFVLDKATRHVLLDGLSKLDYGLADEIAERLRATCCPVCKGTGLAPYVGGDDDKAPCRVCGGSGMRTPPAPTGDEGTLPEQELAMVADEIDDMADDVAGGHDAHPDTLREWRDRIRAVADRASAPSTGDGEPQGLCSVRSPSIAVPGHETTVLMCELPAGHAGDHQAGETRWGSVGGSSDTGLLSLLEDIAAWLREHSQDGGGDLAARLAEVATGQEGDDA